ncbi:MAG: peptidoglycan DD-metalloendopeptidase family protein [Clostridia bacterium]|nr:peptidoglycan DD-metalloendopeptidase family protein [Clostridia bacterium]
MKKLFKKILIIWAIICVLLPTLFTGVALAAEVGYLNTERAGNFASNFAINFYENWSSVSLIEENDGTGNANAYVNGNHNFVWPIAKDSYSISSEFGPRSLDNHKGMDLAAPKGTPVYASCSGIVKETFSTCPHNFPKNSSCECGSGYGNNIKIDTGDGFLVIYGHLTDVLVKVGDQVKQGQQIATVGCTGWSTGDHLHFELATNDINGLDATDYIDRTKGNGGIIFGYKYSVNPKKFVSDRATISSSNVGSSSSRVNAQSVLAAGQQIYDNILLGNTKIAYIAYSGRDAEQISSNKTYSEAHGMDCSTFVSAALWLAGYDDFKSTKNTYMLEDGCLSGEYVRKYGFGVYRSDKIGRVFQLDENGNEHELVGEIAEKFMQPGDIIVVNLPDRSNGHTNIVKEVRTESSNKYLALDCGNSENWQNVNNYNTNGGGVNFDIWTSVNWDSYYGGTNRAFLIRASGTGRNTYTNNSSNVIIRGQIKTEYDATVNPMDEIDPKTEGNYKFNNISWIGFAYRNALFNNKVENVLTGSGNSITINTEKFDDKYSIDKIKDVANDSKYLDIATLISEGKVKPGDILYSEYTIPDENGNEKEVKEYLLYVGGTSIIYASEDPRVAASGALKYEYIEHYLKRIRQRIKSGHENEEDFIMPKYGITQVYRLKDDVASNILEADANLMFNGKGYYSKTKYDGMPTKIGLSQYKINLVQWLFEAFGKVLEFLLNLLLYIIRMIILGWANLVENLIQHIVLGISGDNNDASIWNTVFGTSATSASGERITVESIFYNQIPILDANFFDMETAGGRDMFAEGAEGKNGIVYSLRNNLRNIYVVIRNLSIALMLLILIIYGIKIAITSSAEKKADFKKFLTSWLIGMAVVMFIHVFMIMVFELNSTLVGICKTWENEMARKSVADVIQITNSQQELNLYDAVRTKAYAFSWREGVPATIMYIFLIYLMIRFLSIYLKRYLTIYLLALSGSFMGVKFAIDRLLGKKTTTLNKWFKDFAFNVLLQTVHAFIYLLFIGVAISVSSKSVAGALIAAIILNFMLKADKIIIKIFGLDKAGSLATVNEPESFRTMFREFMPIYSISKGAAGLFVGEDGLIRKVRYFFTDTDNMKDARKEIDKRNYEWIGRIARKVDGWKIPIRELSRYHDLYKQMGNNLDADTNKKILALIKDSKRKRNQRYLRRLNMAKDLTLGTAGKIASLGVMIANPMAGIGLYAQSKKMIKKYKSPNKTQLKAKRYGGSTAKARTELERARNTYKEILDRHTHNELMFEEQFNRLKDDYRRATTAEEKQRLKELAESLLADREKERSVELHELTIATEKEREAKTNYEKARFENNMFMKTVGKVTGLSAAEDIAFNEIANAEKAKKDDEKAGKKIKDMTEIAKIEKDLRKDTNNLKDKIKEYAKALNTNDNGEVNEEQAKETAAKMLKDSLNSVYKESKKVNVKSSYIARAVSDYLARKDIARITSENVDEVLEEIKEVMAVDNKTFDITNELRNNVQEALESKMLKDRKGLGLEKKDTVIAIRQAIAKGKDHLTRNNNNQEETDELRELRRQIQELEDLRLQKINKINTYNEVGKIKYKSSLVNVNKIIKDTSK